MISGHINKYTVSITPTAPGRILMNESRATLYDTLRSNDDPCDGYYLSCNYSTEDDVAQHLAFRIKVIALTPDNVVIHVINPDDASIVRLRFSGAYTALENPDGNGGVWFKQDYGEHGMWWCIAPHAHAMGLVTS
jgi:hypothetical protein